MKAQMIIAGTLVTCFASAFAASSATYPIVDTGQTQAFGSYAGQDGHYLANAPSYKDNGDGTVTDNVTGLMWTKNPGEKMTWDDAGKNASKCRVGDHKDWRLPSIKELYSLIQFTGLDPDPTAESTSNLKPFIDKAVFDFKYGDTSKGERIIDSQFATTAIYTSTTMGGNKTMFGVNFADGRIKGYPVVSRRGYKTFHVLYVRGNPDYGKNKFKDNGDGTITDEATGLTWMQADSGNGMDWPSALKYAENTKFAGKSDWRLPTAKELQSILDYSRSPDATDSPAIDPVFETTEIQNEGGKKDYAQYWSSTTHLSSRSNESAAYVNFGRSLGWMENRRSGQKTLMDVHGAGAQRSDPKTGDTSRYPYGRGPQGDVIRIENMVRLVRGGEVKKVEPKIVAEKERTPPGRNSQSSMSRQGNHSAQQPQRRRDGPSRRLLEADVNGDGSISRDEFRGPPPRFRMLDANSDGIIDADEIKSAPQPRRRQQGGASGQGRQQGGDSRRPDAATTARPTSFDLQPSGQASSSKPNILFIFTDDMGWTGTSVEMISGDKRTRSDYYQTPNLERLASSGVVFSQAYAPASLCTPTRAAIPTGKTPAEIHITTPGAGRSDGTKKVLTPRRSTSLPRDLPTIGTILKDEGYATALLGKWHIGRSDHAGLYGFDFHDGATQNETQGTEQDPAEAVNGIDLFATFAGWAGAKHSSAESADLRPLLAGEDDHFKRTLPQLFHFPHYGQGPQKPQSALIANGWKLVKNWESNAYELFNPSDDLTVRRSAQRVRDTIQPAVGQVLFNDI